MGCSVISSPSPCPSASSSLWPSWRLVWERFWGCGRESPPLAEWSSRFTLFLTVSFHSSPYYTGADIVFVFAWIPLVLAGSGGVLSLDGVIAARVAERIQPWSANSRSRPFRARVQQVCGHYDNDSCDARDGNRCDVRGCPFLSANPVGLPSMFKEGGLDPIERRKFVLGGAPALTAAVAGGAVAGATAGLGRVVGGAKSPGGQSVTLKPTAHEQAGCHWLRRDHDIACDIDSGHCWSRDRDWPGQPGTARRGRSLHRSQDRRPWSCPPTRRRGGSSPSTPSAPMPDARWGIRPPPNSSFVRVTAPNSTRLRAAW